MSSSTFLTYTAILFAALVGSPFARAQTEASDWVKTQKQWKELESKKAVVLKNEGGSGKKEDGHAATAAIIVNAPMKAVWDVISDKEGAADYVKNLQKAKIIEETDEYYLVEQTVKIGLLKPVTYVVKNFPEAPYSVEFTRHSGDLKEIDGYWKLCPLDDGNKTLLVYRLGLKPGFAVPDFLVKNSLKSSLPEALREVRTEVARRAALQVTASR